MTVSPHVIRGMSGRSACDRKCFRHGSIRVHAAPAARTPTRAAPNVTAVGRMPNDEVNYGEAGGNMMRDIGSVFVFLATLLATSQVSANDGKLVHLVRFADYELGPVEDWLQGKGFRFEEDARRRDRIDLDVGDKGLVLEAKHRAFGFMPNESVNVPEFTYVEIDWGVNKSPEGASYEKGVRNEAIMLFIFMGDELQPSGSLFIPDSPYFVGLFICAGDDKRNHPYVGSYFKKSGRYVCADRPAVGQLVTSRFDLLEAYRTYFDKERDDDPAISGIALALDTKKAGDGGKASAFIREIRFYR